MTRLAAAIPLVLLVAAAPSLAVTPAEQAFQRWAVQDKCVADAKLAHPNRDPASQRKLDADVDQCLTRHGLPPRAHIAPPADDAPAADPARADR
jgi:hypothetical protein